LDSEDEGMREVIVISVQPKVPPQGNGLTSWNISRVRQLVVTEVELLLQVDHADG
jgi:hypothetical protein